MTFTRADLIRAELKSLANDFEEMGPDRRWTGQEIADAIRERIKNHPLLEDPE